MIDLYDHDGVKTYSVFTLSWYDKWSGIRVSALRVNDFRTTRPKNERCSFWGVFIDLRLMVDIVFGFSVSRLLTKNFGQLETVL